MKRALCCLLIVLMPVVISTAIGSAAQTTNTEPECVATAGRICHLAVQITTEKARGAGTDDAVYFDIGPLAWRLNNPKHNDFEGGQVDQFDLPFSKDIKLTKDDILWRRLQKKGVFGFTGTSDGLDGAWHPERLVLIIDGVPEPAITIKERLNSSCWFWSESHTLEVRESYANARNFARSLRLQANDKLKSFDKFIGFATTPFKKIGISGWLDCPDSRECLQGQRCGTCGEMPKKVCATGQVSESATSTDGLATTDLKVSTIEFCRDGKMCSDQVELKDVDPVNQRYIRIEYRHKGRRVPKCGERVRVCGKLRWDTDKEGWWEIHPCGGADITFLEPAKDPCQ
jgi:hypothetical protein